VIIPPHVSGQTRALDRGHTPQDIGDLCLQQLQLAAGLRDRQAGGVLDGGGVNQARRERVLDALKTQGYRRNSAGRAANEAELRIVDDDTHHDLDQGPFAGRAADRTAVDRSFLWQRRAQLDRHTRAA